MKAENNNYVLECKNVDVGYGYVPVVSDVNLSIGKGEFFGLMGLNGSGKTTLIKSILGLRDHLKGDILVFGDDKNKEKNKKHLAFLPERFEPPWFLTGYEFLKFSLSLYGKKFDKSYYEEHAEKLALDPKALKKKVQTYSKGMRQKLGLLSVILTQCELLILDEPMSGLDPRARALVKDMLVNAKSQNQTIFICSHILADMEELCERTALLHAGKIMYVGPPKELLKTTKTENLERAFLSYIEKDKAA